jgi:hypothetical protein
MIRRGCTESALARGRDSRHALWGRGMATAGLLMVALIAAGCGSSSNGDSTTSMASGTKAAFVAKANAICVKGTTQTEKAGQALGNNPTEQEAAVAVPAKFVPAVQAQIDELKALSAPSGEEVTVTSMLNLAQGDLNKVKSDPRLAFETKTFADFAKVAHAYGLKSCAPRS